MDANQESLALPAGASVGRYRILELRAGWGFCLSYLGEHTVAGHRVAVHELLPAQLLTRAIDGALAATDEAAREKFAWAREQFRTEGRKLAACAAPGVQPILEVLEERGTVFWITAPDEPVTLKAWLEELGRAPTETELRRVLDPLLAALGNIHSAGLLHLNLKPGTIQLTPAGEPVLARFAGSRQAIAREIHEAITVTAGYSPPEQYRLEAAESPASDLYAVAAVLYRAITGAAPPDGEKRFRSDPYEKLAGRFSEYDARLLVAIDAALAPDPTARPQSVAAWQRMLGAPGAPPAPVPPPARAAPCRRPRQMLAGAAVAALVIFLAIWILRPPEPIPGEQKIETNQETNEQRSEEMKPAEDAKQFEDASKMTPPQGLAAQQAAQAKVAAERAAAERLAAAEKRAAETKKAQGSTESGYGKSLEGGTGKFPGKSAAPGVPGVWETLAKHPDGRAMLRLTVHTDGRFKISDQRNWTDAGEIYAYFGHASMKSDGTGGVVLATYKLRNLRQMLTTGALGDQEWVRVGAPPD